MIIRLLLESETTHFWPTLRIALGKEKVVPSTRAPLIAVLSRLVWPNTATGGALAMSAPPDMDMSSAAAASPGAPERAQKPFLHTSEPRHSLLPVQGTFLHSPS